MRRFVTLCVLLLFSIPFGISISGCSHNAAPVFCNGGDSGITTGQVTNITLNPLVYGISLNYAEIGQVNSPAASDCKGNNASVGSYTYGTTDMTIADIQPSSGRLCGGTWNRNSGGGIPDYTYCIPTEKSGIAYITASAEDVTSNPLPVFVHPVVTSIVLGGASTNCAIDATTICAPTAINSALIASANAACPTSSAYPSNPQLANGCCSIPPNTVLSTLLAPAQPYSATSCLSQGSTAQLVARVYAGAGANQTNISCLAGHLQYTVSGATSTTTVSPVLSIDQNGIATANQPGSVLITANISNASSSAGYFSTCPPASITLTASGATTNPVIVNQNNPQALTATAIDTNGNPLTGLALEYLSTSPTTIPGSGTIVPPLAGSASISAVCQPPACNSSAYNQIGLFGNGKPVTSNFVDITAPGTNSTVLYMASSQSKYVASRDFTQSQLAAPLLLPFQPNSMLISNDGTSIYMGSSSGLMVLNAVNQLNVSRVDITSPGTVLAVSPDSSVVVISDPVKQITTLETSSGATISSYSGVGTEAEFSPDSQTVYITAGDQLLIYSDFTGWTNLNPATPGGTPVTDVAVTVPDVGAYFAGPTTTARGYCPASTPATVGGSTTETNVFYPPADSSPATNDLIAATNDGLHILGATVTPVPTLNDLHVQIPSSNGTGVPVSIPCPSTGGLTFSNTDFPTALPQIPAGNNGNTSTITGVLPASDSSIAFITYSLPTAFTGTPTGLVPAYVPSASGAGTLSSVQLSGTATAPIAGVFSADNHYFYVGSSGDGLVHILTNCSIGGLCLGSSATGWTDTGTLAPSLPGVNGGTVAVNLVVQKPRKTT